MDKQELDGVRQLLEIALKNLNDQAAEGKAGADGVSLFVDRSGSFTTTSEAPLVVILAGGSREPGSAGILPAARNVAPSDEKAGGLPGCGCDPTEKKHSHPGLERFTIEADSHPSVPKTCFMEPGRACVNSGACEMRGF
jgi:hypothetical protein